ncbi:(2E,6E)-farnesyl diphosphate synthase [Actinomadura rubteroloni]|uniref:(2E,6E)-farnesyl diphosphate synthase n=1 Tax=Actinomadura rubteroloni TaxID=1926885 RepID=A0A2P4UQ81_9ACTN|nr:polyprenyl synthetase family protein [Actinomadura rubteroloni]POM27184.1 (2E,6E)-farnesyl diphosphate synthase [Actinomadura rubteroloni]
MDRLRSRVDAVLAAFLDARLDTVRDGAVRTAFRTVRDFVLDGGDRVRPLLCYWGWRGAGGDDRPEVVRAAAALEVFHAFRLIHDDVMDGGDLRRGRPSLHRALAGQHAARRWRGDSERFGLGTALLLGDLCMAWADELLTGCGLEPARLAAARPYYDDMRSEVFYGRYLDLLEQARGPSSPQRSLTVARYKTAKYTVERPLQLGGALAGAPPELLAAYSAFGLAAGEAFQLRDDVLGTFGDPSVTGRSRLDDLRAGKPTVLIAHALERADPAQRRVIETLHGDRALDEDGAARLRAVITATGAPAAVEAMIRERDAAALEILAAAPVPEQARLALEELTTAALRRTA